MIDVGELSGDRWKRQKGEPERAYIMFLAYRDVGLGRSLRKLFAAEAGNAPAKQVAGNVKEWSSTLAVAQASAHVGHDGRDRAVRGDAG